MRLDEIKDIFELTISNEFGSVLFFGRTDLSNVDLGKDVTINQKTVEIYENCDNKPGPNQKLNKPALITFNQFLPKKEETDEACSNRLRVTIEKQGGEFISYGNKELMFKVPYF